MLSTRVKLVTMTFENIDYLRIELTVSYYIKIKEIV